VEFFVFADGEFDFNTRASTRETYFKPNDGRGNVNKTYGAAMNSRKQDFGVKIGHDAFGKVRRIGNIFVNYDSDVRIR
jgi:hypothetical protein